jgi:hypothetical protein
MFDDTGTVQYVLRTAGKGYRFRMLQGIGKAWLYQDQLTKPHGFNGSRSRTYIARMTGFNQDKAQALKKRCVSFGQVHLK